MCFNKVEEPKTLRRHTLVKNSITQITGDFIKKIGEIFKESEKLYETEEKIKLQTQNSETNLMELFIEQIDNEILRDRKKRKAEDKFSRKVLTKSGECAIITAQCAAGRSDRRAGIVP